MRAEAVCAYPKELKDVAARICTLTPPRHWACDLKRRICRIVPPVDGLWNCQVHENCTCNELVSLHNRHLQQVPEPTKQGIKDFVWALGTYARNLDPVEPISEDEFLSHYTGPKRTRYVNAFEKLREFPLSPRDALIDAFIKAEKFSPHEKENPDPRLIQARSPRYNAYVGRYFRPMFGQFKRLQDGIGSRIIVKGMNMPDRAALFMEKWGSFRNPVAISVDGSRFDAHLHRYILGPVDGLYKRLASCAGFASALDSRRRTKGKTMNGVKYCCCGRRCSGDFDTGDGNSLCMACMIKAAMKRLGIARWAAMVDGDDAVLIIEKEWLGYLRGELVRVFLTFGQEITIDEIAFSPSQVKMCQARMMEVEPGVWNLVRDWRKVLSHETSGFRHWDQPTVVRAMMATVGLCDLALFRGLPILQEYALALRRIGGDVIRPDLLELDELIYRFGLEFGRDPCVKASALSAAVPVSQFARQSFERTFGVSIEMQCSIEESLKSWQLTSVNPRVSGREWDFRWIDLTPPDFVRF